MELPVELIERLRVLPGFDEDAFRKAHLRQAPVSLRLNPDKVSDADNAGKAGDFLRLSGMEVTGQVPWCPAGYYLAERPRFTLDPLLHAGAYYVQEASSMFLHFALDQALQGMTGLAVLDLCAAPGGKTTLLATMEMFRLVVSNEIIRTRVNILYENTVKWGNPKILVANDDPSVFSAMPPYFDVLVVDAPCSGSGLFRKDTGAIALWSEANVQHCAARQERILTDALPALKAGGLLVYSTCSYSPEEDEQMLDWLISDCDLEPMNIDIPETWGICTTHTALGATGYRFFPDKLEGEGFFISCFVKKGESITHEPGSRRPSYCSSRERSAMEQWVRQDMPLAYIWQGDHIVLLPEGLVDDLMYLKEYLHLRKTGVLAGYMARDQFIPDHELALSILLNPVGRKMELDLEEALHYLKKQVFNAKPAEKGWQVITHRGLPLGWIKDLGNRINNYYPAAWRILKP